MSTKWFSERWQHGGPFPRAPCFLQFQSRSLGLGTPPLILLKSRECLRQQKQDAYLMLGLPVIVRLLMLLVAFRLCQCVCVGWGGVGVDGSHVPQTKTALRTSLPSPAGTCPFTCSLPRTQETLELFIFCFSAL